MDSAKLPDGPEFEKPQEWKPYIENQFVVMGPDKRILDTIREIQRQYHVRFQRLDRRALPLMRRALLKCPDFAMQLEALDHPPLSNLSGCLERFFENRRSPRTRWVLDLYEIRGGALQVEEAVREINNRSKCLFADPNYLTADPYTAVGSPYTAVGSPYTAVGSPCAGNGVQADGADFWGQWALERIGVASGGAPTPNPSQGEGVLVGVFDTSPFPYEDFDTESEESVSWAAPPWGSDPLLRTSFPRPLAEPPLLPDNPDVRCHGLYVAGLVRAVAPLSTIHLYRTLNDKAVGDLFTLSAAICDFIGRAHAEAGRRRPSRAVINLSLGVMQLEDPIGSGLPEDVACLMLALGIATCSGIVIAAAAGNESWAMPRPGPANIPARYPYVLGVQGCNVGGARACFSNQGDVAAPGCGLISLIRKPPSETGYCYWSGTSFATPLVSGLAAAVRGKHPDHTARQIRDAIVSNASDACDTTITAGIIDVPWTLR